MQPNRFRMHIMLASSLIVLSGCCSEGSTSVDRSDEKLKARPQDRLVSEDYEILEAVLDSLCKEFDEDRISIQPNTLSGRSLFSCVDLAENCLARAYRIDFTLYPRHMNKAKIETNELSTSECRVHHVGNDRKVDGLPVELAPPVFTDRGRAFVFVITGDEYEGGRFVYCLERGTNGWYVDDMTMLTLYGRTKGSKVTTLGPY